MTTVQHCLISNQRKVITLPRCACTIIDNEPDGNDTCRTPIAGTHRQSPIPSAQPKSIHHGHWGISSAVINSGRQYLCNAL